MHQFVTMRLQELLGAVAFDVGMRDIEVETQGWMFAASIIRMALALFRLLGTFSITTIDAMMVRRPQPVARTIRRSSAPYHHRRTHAARGRHAP